MRWRPVVAASGLYSDWIVDLQGYSGVYAIRDAYSHSVLYVGESHSGRLYHTLTRHFQSPSREYHGPNLNRQSCEGKVQICAPSEVEDLQYDWILRLRPELNELQPPSGDDEVPF